MGLKDDEGCFSATPKPLEKHHADRNGDGSIVDILVLEGMLFNLHDG